MQIGNADKHATHFCVFRKWLAFFPNAHSLLPVFKRGRVEEWVALRSGGGGSSSDASSLPTGEVRITLEFAGPTGVAYPQYRSGVDAFDDAQRINLPGRAAVDAGRASGSKRRSPSHDL